MRNKVILTLAMLAVSASLWAQQDPQDPMIGTWKLNVAKSKFSPGPPPRTGTITIEPYGRNGLKVAIELLNARGEKLHIEYSPRFDGQEYPRIEAGAGAVPGQTITLRRIDSHTVERIAYLAGKKLTTEQWIISSDGKTRYTVQSGPDPQGQQVHNLISLGEAVKFIRSAPVRERAVLHPSMNEEEKLHVGANHYSRPRNVRHFHWSPGAGAESAARRLEDQPGEDQVQRGQPSPESGDYLRHDRRRAAAHRRD